MSIYLINQFPTRIFLQHNYRPIFGSKLWTGVVFLINICSRALQLNHWTSLPPGSLPIGEIERFPLQCLYIKLWTLEFALIHNLIEHRRYFTWLTFLIYRWNLSPRFCGPFKKQTWMSVFFRSWKSPQCHQTQLIGSKNGANEASLKLHISESSLTHLTSGKTAVMSLLFKCNLRPN